MFLESPFFFRNSPEIYSFFLDKGLKWHRTAFIFLKSLLLKNRSFLSLVVPVISIVSGTGAPISQPPNLSLITRLHYSWSRRINLFPFEGATWKQKDLNAKKKTLKSWSKVMKWLKVKVERGETRKNRTKRITNEGANVLPPTWSVQVASEVLI